VGLLNASLTTSKPLGQVDGYWSISANCPHRSIPLRLDPCARNDCKTLFDQQCASCHQPRTGTVVPIAESARCRAHRHLNRKPPSRNKVVKEMGIDPGAVEEPLTATSRQFLDGICYVRLICITAPYRLCVTLNAPHNAPRSSIAATRCTTKAKSAS